jgi:hypothetical protein
MGTRILTQRRKDAEAQRRRSSFVTLFLLLTLLAQPASAATVTPFECQTPPVQQSRIDELVLARLQKLQIEPAAICSDAVFVRRVWLDLTGSLPSAHETQEFLLSKDPKKRSALIDRLMERDEFADFWAMKWSDLLRVKSEFPINLWPNASQAYYRWIHTSVRDNKPWDKFARELLTSSGSNFREAPVNFYRAMQNREPAGIAQTVALTFMGVRADKWPTNQLAGLAAFFSQIGYKQTAEWKEEIVFFEPARATNELWRAAAFPDGKLVTLTPDKDPREVFADWLINPKNAWFTRNAVNRVWTWLLGRGIIHEPDDIRPDNPPCNPELLAYLESEFTASQYDMKKLFRLILNSQTYQRSSLARSDQAASAANFASYPLRRLEAEVLIDAVNQLTGATEKYSSPIPEPFTFIPENQRSTALPDGSITSSFLELFGRPSRDTGFESERNNTPSAAQKLHLLNSSHILRKIEQSRMVEFQSDSKRTPTEIASGMYLGILSRYPTAEETKTVETYFRSASRQRDAVVDLAWALINSAEFLYRH